MSRASATPQFTGISDPSAADVSAAVMAVLREMAGSAAQPAVRPSALHSDGMRIGSRIGSLQGIGTVKDDSIVAFPGKLLLERHAVSLPESTRQIVTTPSTVVTPLAREILRKRGVAVRISNASSMGSPNPVIAGEWAVVRLCDSPQAQSLESMLIGRGGEGWIGFDAAAEAAAGWIETQPAGHLAVLAQSAAHALWWLIRQGVRAAQVQASADVERIVSEFAPRCLVIEPARLPIHESRQIYRAWRALGVQPSKSIATDSPYFVKEARS